MSEYNYYEVVMTERTDNEPNVLIVCVKSKCKPTNQEMEIFFADKMKKYGCDHVDDISEINYETAHTDFYIQKEEDFIIYN